MRNLIIILAFVFTTAFSFAGNNAIGSKLKENVRPVCVTVTTSCGIVGSVCASDTAGLIDAAIDLDNWVCGGGIE